MFVLYAIPIGLVIGWLKGGRLEALGEYRLRWAPLALAGLLAQVVLFSSPLGRVLGDLAPAAYVATTAAVLVVVLLNAGLPGMRLVAFGAAANLAAILANGGYMPASPEALEYAGLSPAADGPSNSIVATNPALGPLTDVFALPDWLPFANVFSIGDLLIGIGIVIAISSGMTRRTDAQAPPDPAPGAPVHGGNSPD